MADQPGQGADPEQVAGEEAQAAKLPDKFQKELEKIQKDKPEFKEGKLEIKESKLEHKEFKEKPEIKEGKDKPEFKEGKNEFKEHKNELKEHKLEKFEHKEFSKFEQKEVIEKPTKIEIKEIEKQIPDKTAGKDLVETGPLNPGDPVEFGQVTRQTLEAHASALEQSAQQIRHFIEESDRPDLGEGALKQEPDQKD
jgi:hypothetical protein